MNAWINNRPVTFEEGETILQVAKRLGIFIPTLCALLPLDHTPGTCRMCITEIERKETPGKRELVTSCTTPMLEGMAVFTHTPEVRHRQRQQAAWIFSDHDQDCASCVRHGNCELQDVALYVGLQNNSCNGRFIAKRPVDTSAHGLLRDVNKCIRCGRCIEACPMGLEPVVIAQDFANKDFAALKARCVDLCVACGSCTYACPAKRPVSQTMGLAKGWYMAELRKGGK